MSARVPTITKKPHRLELVRNAEKELEFFYRKTVSPRDEAAFLEKYGDAYPTFSKAVKKSYEEMILHIHSDSVHKFKRRLNNWIEDSQRLIRMTLWAAKGISPKYKHKGETH